MLIDSNILIYSLNQNSPKQSQAQNFLQAQSQSGSPLIFAQQNVMETLRILTHPKFPNPFPVADALSAVQLITDQAKIISPTLDTLDIAVALIEKYSITGAEIFDAYLVATALSHQIDSIATDNVKHLQKYVEVFVINPFEE